VLAMLEHKELPGRLVDGRWEIPAAAVRARTDALLDRHHQLSQQLVPGAAGAAWLEAQWTQEMLDALAAEIHSARELVAAYADLKLQRQRGAAAVVGRERLENLNAILTRHHAAVAEVEALRRLRAWVDAARATARDDVTEFDTLHPIARGILKARRAGEGPEDDQTLPSGAED